jgi:hypothetical protein
MTIARRTPSPELVRHSDRGVQYTPLSFGDHPENEGLLQAIEEDPTIASSFEPKVTVNQARMGLKEDVLEFGRYLFRHWNVEAHKLMCGSAPDDQSSRAELLNAFGIGETAVAAALATLLVTNLGFAPALAAVLGALLVKDSFAQVTKSFVEYGNRSCHNSRGMKQYRRVDKEQLFTSYCVWFRCRRNITPRATGACAMSLGMLDLANTTDISLFMSYRVHYQWSSSITELVRAETRWTSDYIYKLQTPRLAKFTDAVGQSIIYGCKRAATSVIPANRQ